MDFISAGVFYTEKFIDFKFKNFDGSLSEYEFKILDRICKKIDVVKVIRKEYNPLLSKQLTIDPIDLFYQKKLLKLFLKLFSINGDFKLLNSSFKLMETMTIDKDIVSLKSSFEKQLQRLN
jgi:hypothetical protein